MLGHVEGKRSQLAPTGTQCQVKTAPPALPLPIPNGTEPTGTTWVMTDTAQDLGMAFKQEERSSWGWHK